MYRVDVSALDVSRHLDKTRGLNVPELLAS